GRVWAEKAGRSFSGRSISAGSSPPSEVIPPLAIRRDLVGRLPAERVYWAEPVRDTGKPSSGLERESTMESFVIHYPTQPTSATGFNSCYQQQACRRTAQR